MARIPLPPGLLRRPVAHRGLHDAAAGRPENGLSAIRAAIGHGYSVEIDVQLSRDGEAIVFHDEDLDRMTGQHGPLADRTAAELGRIRLAGSTDTIPTLAEVLALTSGRAPLLVELKDRTGLLTGTDGRLEDATARLVGAAPGEVAVMSFNPAMVAAMAERAPACPRGLVTAAYDRESWEPLAEETLARLRAIPDYDATGSGFISHEAADLARPRVAALKAAGAAILCWTVTSPAEEERARRVAHNVTFEGYLPPVPP